MGITILDCSLHRRCASPSWKGGKMEINESVLWDVKKILWQKHSKSDNNNAVKIFEERSEVRNTGYLYARYLLLCAPLRDITSRHACATARWFRRSREDSNKIVFALQEPI
jgi:hypothetical protein